ncbi:MAG: LacI family DNA-binding transcriptional regulator [Caldilineaceae bacterium]|nr:LacI family DNA-binding transcriptional regulator [Caldilineaceae bacterium]
MSVTLRDVARLSGVSVSTTSRALNDRLDVSEAVRARVLKAAQELNYTVNHQARVLKGAASKTLGLILYNTESLTFNAVMTRGIYDLATPNGYSVIVCNSNAGAEMELQAHQMLRQNRVDGMLINSVESGPASLEYLLDNQIPFVLLNRRVPGIECDYVVVDYQQGEYLAARHLLELGHRRILCQLGIPSHPPTIARLAGYRRALEEFGVEFAQELVVHASNAANSYHPVLNAMRQIQPRPTAILAYNDETTIPVLKALSDLGLHIPKDVSVVGQNDLSFAPFLIPPLTSVAQSIHEMGRLGMEILLQKITHQHPESWGWQQIVLAPTLNIRQSTAPPHSV